MHTRTVEQVRSWDSRPYDGGLDALSTLSDEGHTGAVVAADTWLFMLNGRVIGLFEGTMDDFEAAGTVYSMPHESLPLLFAMQEREGRTRAKYFTEDTPLTEADATLADANFTGYIQLSENVLSGDYYLVYYGGERRSVAFIGQSERVETGNTAFEKATDEVGLYEVKDVSMNITEIPTPEPQTSTEPGATSAGVSTDESQTQSDESGEATSTERTAATDSHPPEQAQDEPTTDDSTPAEAESAAPHIDSATDSESPSTADSVTATSNAPPDETEATDPTSKQTAESAEADPTGESAPSGPNGESTRADPTGESAESEQSRELAESEQTREPAESEPTEASGDGMRGSEQAAETSADSTESAPPATSNEEQTEASTARGESSEPNPSVTNRRSGTRSAESTADSAPDQADGQSPTERRADRQEPPADDTSDETDPADSELEQMFRAEAEWRQTRSIPALDPDETEPVEEPSAGTTSDSKPTMATTQTETDSSSASPTASATDDSGPTAGTSGSIVRADEVGTESAADTASPSKNDTSRSAAKQKLQAAIDERDERIDVLEDRLTAAEDSRSELESQLEAERETRAEFEAELEAERGKRADLEAELDEIRTERDQLASRVEELEATEEAMAGTAGGSDMRPPEALSGTNLFVRYGSKGEPTLEALEGEAERQAINQNLALEHHTQFEADSVTVEEKPFREFLESTGSFRFADWVLRELPYELLETGNRQSLGDLFEAIPEIDRIEFDGSVTVDPESGDESQFSVVMRDRMGNPLIVGEYTDRRNPVQGAELQALLDGATEVAGSTEHLAGAFYVTASFFEPAALERAETAASSGGLFSRQEKASYVTPESGGGFHLGLVEDRSGAFHVTVPKL